ncbi:tetratricopeptide repeat protein [Streptomyces flavofungini]|uniref:tetratricopeptide repeat protein n=1 Tax=Streptomyces flavofungini TaxID=68200 RepID=UPI0025B03CEA|nr:tetratricopeptide repeat protein [Streptomyces flavofungini]WJV49752.1 tetratricopeptide repeat protein [Streptomyces flavofungini]
MGRSTGSARPTGSARSTGSVGFTGCTGSIGPAEPVGSTGSTESAGSAGVPLDGTPAGERAGDDGGDARRLVGAPGGRTARAGLARRAGWRLGAVVALAVTLTAGAVVVGAVREEGRPSVAAAPPAPYAAPPDGMRAGDLDRAVSSLRERVRARPRDFASWAALGSAYVEQARTHADPTRYDEAERALDRALALRPGHDVALAGQGALAAARHDFPGALRHAKKALAVNPYNERALATRIDALVELGAYDRALRAARDADARRPGIPVFTRYAYVRELRGDVGGARRVLERALASARAPGDVAYVATALAQLAWRQGQYARAARQCAVALRADPSYVPALETRGRVRAARGETGAAVADLRDAVARQPLPGTLVALGELYESQGKSARAREQYRLIHAWTRLARANGVNPDLDTALAAVDHGDAKAALAAARAEWGRRRTVHTADALGWALHAVGRDEEALRYARRATATGFREASFSYHRGVIELRTGSPAAGRRWLERALGLNSGFSPVGSRDARRLLEGLR